MREFQTDSAAVLKERLPKEVRLNGTCSSGADDDRNDRVLLRVVIHTVRPVESHVAWLTHALAAAYWLRCLACVSSRGRSLQCNCSALFTSALSTWHSDASAGTVQKECHSP